MSTHERRLDRVEKLEDEEERRVALCESLKTKGECQSVALRKLGEERRVPECRSAKDNMQPQSASKYIKASKEHRTTRVDSIQTTRSQTTYIQGG